MASITRVATLIAATLALAGCSEAAPPAKPLVDGCYYAGTVPTLKIQGGKGLVLIPGEISEFEVEGFFAEDGTWVGEAWIETSPGFLLRGDPLWVEEAGSRSSMLMKREAAQPTILAAYEAEIDLELVLGPECKLPLPT